MLIKQFVAANKFMQLAVPPSSASTDIRVEIGGGSGKDEIKVKLFVAEGAADPTITNGDILTKPPAIVNNITYSVEGTAHRDQSGDVVFNVSQLFTCVTPGKTYTIGLLLTFEQGLGTDDTVRVIMPDKLTVNTSNNNIMGTCV
jgi:hypothetical protein